MMSLQYNSSRDQLGYREYGRLVMSMVNDLLKIKDREERTQRAAFVVEVMATLTPHLKQIDDYKQMLWDHLYAISDFKLDVDGPYPKPKKETFAFKGEKMKYPDKTSKYAHLGKNIVAVVKKATDETDPVKKNALSDCIAYYMKNSYANWHNETIQEDVVRNEIYRMSKGALDPKGVSLFNKSFFNNNPPQNKDREEYNKLGYKPPKPASARTLAAKAASQTNYTMSDIELMMQRERRQENPAIDPKKKPLQRPTVNKRKRKF